MLFLIFPSPSFYNFCVSNKILSIQHCHTNVFDRDMYVCCCINIHSHLLMPLSSSFFSAFLHCYYRTVDTFRVHREMLDGCFFLFSSSSYFKLRQSKSYDFSPVSAIISFHEKNAHIFGQFEIDC